MYVPTRYEKLYKKIIDTVHRLLEFYGGSGNGAASSSDGGSGGSVEIQMAVEVEKSGGLLSQFMRHMKEKNVIEVRNEVDRYLSDPIEDLMVLNFDLLSWWRNNSSKYKILSEVARDILVVPISTVASKAFSTRGRVLDAFRSSLSARTVEALICTQNWMQSHDEERGHNDYMEEVNAYEDIDLGAFIMIY